MDIADLARHSNMGPAVQIRKLVWVENSNRNTNQNSGRNMNWNLATNAKLAMWRTMKGSRWVENSDRKFRRRIKNSFGKPTVPSRWMDIHHCAAANGNTKHRIHNIFVHLSLGKGVFLHNTSSIHCISAPKTRTYCSEFPGSFGSDCTTGQMHKFCRFGRCCSGSIVILWVLGLGRKYGIWHNCTSFCADKKRTNACFALFVASDDNWKKKQMRFF